MNWHATAVVIAAIGPLLAGCQNVSSDDNGDPDSDPRETLCSIAVDGFALGLEEYKRTQAIGQLLGAASNAVAIPCRNATANLQQGRPMTFELLRPNATPLTLSVDLTTLTMEPPPVPPPGSTPEVQQRWSSCWSDYSVSNWMVDLCLRGAIDPLRLSE